MARFDLTDDSVVVIVGSGAGGGTLGNELAQRGIKTVILEAGDRYTQTPNVAYPNAPVATPAAEGADRARPPTEAEKAQQRLR